MAINQFGFERLPGKARRYRNVTAVDSNYAIGQTISQRQYDKYVEGLGGRKHESDARAALARVRDRLEALQHTLEVREAAVTEREAKVATEEARLAAEQEKLTKFLKRQDSARAVKEFQQKVQNLLARQEEDRTGKRPTLKKVRESDAYREYMEIQQQKRTEYRKHGKSKRWHKLNAQQSADIRKLIREDYIRQLDIHS